MNLKPCAHCAKGRVEMVDAPPRGEGPGVIHIICRGCGVRTSRQIYRDIEKRAEVAAILRDVWNRRDYVETD